MLGTSAVFAGAAVGSPGAEREPVITAPSVPAASPSATPTPARPTPAAEAAANRLRTCSVNELAEDSRLGQFQAQVRNAKTGDVLFDRGGGTASRTASVLKVLTSAAALEVLGPDFRAETSVVKGAEPGTIVLIGGGDVTLSRTATGDESAYAGAAHLDDLAGQVKAAWAADPANADTPITRLVLDASYFGGPAWHPSWERKELRDGYIPEITALMVDGDRDNPYNNVSARSDDPVARAGNAFASLLGGGLSVEEGKAPAGAAVLGSVKSAPVGTLVKQSLIVSDNAIAEMLARITAIESGTGNTFDALQKAIPQALEAYGIDTDALKIVDGSGLSDDNAVPPSYLTKLFRKVLAGERNLTYVFDGLPIAGETGSLSYSDRFTGDNAVADGSVFAKTGWIDTGYTLAGIIQADDGTPLTFAVYALGDVSENAKNAIDTITAAFYRCGDNLSNN